jgi:hypothetical protein
MKLYKDVLLKTTCIAIKNEIISASKEFRWAVSSYVWPENIKVNISGSVMELIPSPTIRDLISQDIVHLIPPFDDISIKFYAWQKNSGISWHHDAHQKFGATIYLNDEWDINDGGIFVYEHDGELKAHLPTFNTMMINDNKSGHMVTPVSPFAKHDRYTVQIFGVDKNE